jgi:hypothetical protein
LGKKKGNEAKVTGGRRNSLPRAMKKGSKKHILTVAGLSAFCLTAIVLCALNIYTQTWTPFREINLSKSPAGTKIIVEYTAKVPVRVYAEYGTNPTTMLKRELDTEKFTDRQTLKIAHVLPDKEHFVRLTATTEEGDEFKSRFLKIR